MRRRSALLAVVAFVAATAGGIDGTATPALAAERCDGVWVVVDARTAGGSLTTRCAEGDPSSGIRALGGTGHDVAYVPGQPGLVCTIDGRPDPCNGAPADAYWSYWYASARGSWTYSNQGAGARDPAPGSVEGWRFGDGSAPPGTAPPSNEAPEPTPEPELEPEPEPAPAPPSSSSGTASSGDSVSGDAAAPNSGDSEASDDPDDSERPAVSEQTDEDPDPQRADEPEPADENADDTEEPDENAARDTDGADRGDGALETRSEALDGQAAGQDPTPTGDDGPPWALILAVVVVVAIGGATLYRRRRPSQPPQTAG